jgi:hypothetical protein
MSVPGDGTPVPTAVGLNADTRSSTKCVSAVTDTGVAAARCSGDALPAAMTVAPTAVPAAATATPTPRAAHAGSGGGGDTASLAPAAADSTRGTVTGAWTSRVAPLLVCAPLKLGDAKAVATPVPGVCRAADAAAAAAGAASAPDAVDRPGVPAGVCGDDATGLLGDADGGGVPPPAMAPLPGPPPPFAWPPAPPLPIAGVESTKALSSDAGCGLAPLPLPPGDTNTIRRSSGVTFCQSAETATDGRTEPKAAVKAPAAGGVAVAAGVAVAEVPGADVPGACDCGDVANGTMALIASRSGGGKKGAAGVADDFCEAHT